ncbi:LIM domain only protein 7b isoform X2 [Hoplias malabaricus]|uniref:LIM domain only protein 7b isoform X2 n=1 Tax=Hoplias malabaricus TaxID=27720 RepID=UPI00346245BA
MEWREQSTLSCEVAFAEAQRWMEEVTGKRFGSSNFRSALENGVLLCDLINKLKPGIIKRVNRLSTPIAGLDNVNVFLKACGKLGLNDAQLFHPGDLQDVSTRVTVRREETSRRLKNVLITVYWLGRKAQADPSYSGPQLNFKAFEGLLGVALSKALEESSCPKPSVRDSGYGENCYSDREDLFGTQQPSYRREDSVESLDSVDSRTLSVASDYALIAGSEGFGSDTEAEHYLRMSEGCRRQTHTGISREKGNVPVALRRKRVERHQEGTRGHARPLPRSKSMSDITLEPIPQESECSVSFNPLRSYQSPQLKDSEVILEPSGIDQVQMGYLQQARTKAGEDRWQERSGCHMETLDLQKDLDRWKTRRLSTNSDLRRKKEEREQLELFASGGDGLRTAVLRGVQEESDQEGVLQRATCQQPQVRSQEPSTAQEASSRRHYLSQPQDLKEEPLLGSLASDEVLPPSEASPQTPVCSMPGTMSSAGSGAVNATLVDTLSTPVASSLSNGAIGGDTPVTDETSVTTSVFFSPPESTDPEFIQEATEPAQQSVKSVDGVVSASTRMSATLPRGFRRSEGGSRLSTGVTPRPFGTKATRVSSLPRFYSMDDSHNVLIKGQRERPQLPKSFTCQEVTTLMNKDQMGSSTQNGSHRIKQEEDGKNHSAPEIKSFMSASIKQRTVSESGQSKAGHTDMRVSLNQNPSSGTDFGFQAHWDSTGACIKFIKPGGPAHLCHLQVGDEIVAVGGKYVAEMSYEQWKANMDAALKEGSLLMDVRRHGLNGQPEHCFVVNNSCDLPVEKVTESKVNGHTVNVKAVNRRVCDVPTMTKNKGGSESVISDLQVPSISASTSRWSWDAEEERRRQEKWQMEQERILQEKYRRDQERLDEQWKRAQLEAAGEEYSSPEQKLSSVSNGSATPYTPPPFLYQSTGSTFSSQRAPEVRQVTMKKASGHQTKEECDSPTKSSQWPSESYGFAELTALDRKKSKSSPALDSSHKQDSRDLMSVKKRGQVSRAEKDRRQILEEMRKKTQLHTDSSWIRQRSTCTIYKEPINVAPIRRYDSLDSLQNSSPSFKQFSTMSNPARPHSALANITPYRGYSGRCSLGPGAAIFSNSSRQNSSSSTSSTPPVTSETEVRPSSQQHGRLVSGRRICSRCEQPLGKGAAMVIDSLDLCFHTGCFKCVSCRSDLGRGAESRAQVRVRHRRLFCNNCYSRLRVRSGIPK